MDRFKSNCNLLPSTSALLLSTQLTLQLFILLLVSAMLISILVLGIKLIAYLQVPTTLYLVLISVTCLIICF